MFAIAFDLCISDLQGAHPKGEKGVSQAYEEIREVLAKQGFEWIQGSVYTNNDESMTAVFLAIEDLKEIPWFSKSVRDIRAFQMQNWSDFTEVVKS